MDRQLAEKIRCIANYGSDRKYHHIYKGTNSRLDEMQAAFLTVKLQNLDRWNAWRKNAARIYLQGIHNERIVLPKVAEYADPVWHIFAIRCKERDSLIQWLDEAGIGTGIHYPIPMHLQKAYEDLKMPGGTYPIAEMIADEEVSLPMFYGLTEEEQRYIIDSINGWKA